MLTSRVNLEDVETDGLSKGTALTNGNGVTFLNTESGGDVSSKGTVTLLETVVLGDVVHVITADNESTLHLESTDNTLEDATTNGDIRGERALLVNVRTKDSGLGGLEAKANALVVADGLLGGTLGEDSLKVNLLVGSNASLLLVGFLVLDKREREKKWKKG